MQLDYTKGAKGIDERNRALLTSLHSKVTGPFTVQDAAKVLGLESARTRRFLAYLASRGWLSRVRPGLYVAVPMEAAQPSKWREDPWIVAAKAFDPCYIGGWSACEHWGLTEQVFRDLVVITAQHVRNRRPTIQGVQFRIRVVPESMLFGTQSVWRREVRVQVSDPARTVVDLLDDPSLGGGIRHVANVTEAYFGGNLRDDERLFDYAQRVGNRTVYKRLGYLVESLQLDLPGVVATCQARKSAGLSVLDPTVEAKGRLVTRWSLWANVRITRAERT